ncbi:uncharacterized protein BJ171DRAFT_512542 [Polychytrium aggregatum]|uniref:uncharacterized protein n=1 Tax=Polychytrium aggregatum TaxID=110093 RepID=UPI0022FEADC0|nr:uncharacterized protein BJ171DRAFT_512542 [Polychytrium aggregatum]KAI9202892.1 hypothetical protein BJ171DRAFT_512542 [Polychytrium aggregatum]
MMIRSTYMRLKPEHTDVYFVMCSIDQENAGWYASMVHFEAINHRDIIILDSCTENMDMGKTYSYFEFVGRPHSPSVVGTLQLPAYDYVMKTDDDVFLHLPNLEARLAGIPRNLAYYGRQFSGFMTGMGYALSYDLVRWISQECEYCAENKVGQEDFMVAKWMIHSGKRIHWISEDSEHYDAPEFKQGWSHPYTSGTILIHRLKDDKWFMNAAARFVLPFI